MSKSFGLEKMIHKTNTEIYILTSNQSDFEDRLEKNKEKIQNLKFHE